MKRFKLVIEEIAKGFWEEFIKKNTLIDPIVISFERTEMEIAQQLHYSIQISSI